MTKRYRSILVACGVLFAVMFCGMTGSCEELNYRDRYVELAKQYETLKQDRDNVLTQTKRLLAEKTAVVEQNMAFEKMKTEMDAVAAERKELLQKNAVLGERLEKLERSQASLTTERDTLVKDLETARTEGRVGDLEKSNLTLRKDVTALQSEAMTLTRQLASAQEGMTRVQVALSEAEETNRLLREENALAATKNRLFQDEMKKLPKKFAEIARQNKILIKETARMHYNLGVYFTKSKEYQRAATEFEKAVDIDPEDYQSYFNLGYIYAEYMVKRPKAIECFRRYLTLAKSDDKDIDWVRRYLLTWEAYDGKLPIQ